jgi:TonB-linked SusC/RagA family outer membrane protein
LAYRFTDRYIITGTVRHDGSSRFGPGKKWGVFPSLAAAWNISQEPFMENVKFLSNLKLRGSWGKAGNQNIGLFQYDPTYTMGTSLSDNRGYVFGNPKAYYPGFVQNNLANANLTWETSIQSDGGIEASFLDGRINFTADYYDKKSINFLLDLPVPAQTGFITEAKNVGSIKNSGLELSLEYRESSKEFKWSASVNMTTLVNKVLSFTEGVTSISNFSNALGFQDYGGNIWTVYSQSMIGGNIGAFYGFKTAGIYQTQAEIDAANAGAQAKYGATAFYQTSLTSPGDRRFVDVNGDGIITDADRKIIGSPIPKMYGGLHFDASYKQFDFSVFLYGSYGNDIFNYAKRNLETFDFAAGVGIQNIGVEYYNNYWKPDRPSNEYPRLLAYDQVGNNRPSDAYVEDGSYIRLKNLQIGYTLPTTIADKIHSSKIRVFVAGQNLVTFTKYSGLDPEIGDQGGVTGSGIDVGSYPTSRYYSLGLNVAF